MKTIKCTNQEMGERFESRELHHVLRWVLRDLLKLGLCKDVCFTPKLKGKDSVFDLIYYTLIIHLINYTFEMLIVIINTFLHNILFRTVLAK